MKPGNDYKDAPNILPVTQFDVYERYNRRVREGAIDSVTDIETAPRAIRASDGVGCFYICFDHANEEKHLFYDRYSNRMFKSTFGQVLQAEYHLNRNFILMGSQTVNDFYEFLGLEPIPYGDDYSWDIESGLQWIDFDQMDEKFTDDGVPYYEIKMVFYPERLDEYFINDTYAELGYEPSCAQ